MTTILKPKNEGEVRYDTAHRRTRCVIEGCFGCTLFHHTLLKNVDELSKN